MDFSLILFVATVVCGAIWLFDAMLLAPRRKLAMAATAGWNAEVAGVTAPVPEIKESALVEQAKSFFPILLAIFLLRSFLFEPFRIPSGSMKPTLIEGDFILVNKFSYGVRLPVIHDKIIDLGMPKRGDVAVFRYPVDDKTDFIKRVAGLPGDRIAYINKQLIITPACAGVEASNCPQPYIVEKNLLAAGGFIDRGLPFDVYEEQLGEHKHQLLNYPFAPSDRPDFFLGTNEWIVPEGHYFMVGDNRDNSNDSRVWGFVPDENLKGRAVAVWLHLDFELDVPFLGWVPTGISFSRVGGID